MASQSMWNQLKRFGRGRQSRRRLHARRLQQRRSLLETLEQRMLLTTVAWDGEAGDGLWSSPLNWSGDVLPGADDDVKIDVGGPASVRLETATTIASLSLGSDAGAPQDLVLAGSTLTLGGGDANIFPTGRIYLEEGNLFGSVKNQGSVQAYGNSALTSYENEFYRGSLLVEGTPELGNATLQIAGDLTNRNGCPVAQSGRPIVERVVDRGRNSGQ